MADPVTLAIAAAVAGKVAESVTESGKQLLARLKQRVQEKFKDRPEGLMAVLEATQEPEDPQARVRLAEELEAAETEDSAFSAEVRELWQQVRQDTSVGDDGVVNTIHGNVSGNIVQARDMHGDVTF